MYVELMIADGRNEFYQWDTDQLLITDGLSIGSKLHFDMPNTDVPISMSVYEINGESVCRVPDELLQSSGSFKVWAYVTDEMGSRTVYQKTFKVKSREKPPGYIYTETEAWTVQKAVAEALLEAKASGDFKGDKGDPGNKGDKGDRGEKGDKGDPGVVKFVVVKELPETGDEDTIYLVSKETTTATPATVVTMSDTPVLKGIWVFNEHMVEPPPGEPVVNFISNGTAYVGMVCNVDMIEYFTEVGNYSTTTHVHSGAEWRNEAYRTVDFGETEQEVPEDFYTWFTANAVAENIPVEPLDGNLFDEYIFFEGEWEKIGSSAVSANLDEYAKSADMDALVKDSVTNNTETLTDEEKTAACGWLGAVEKRRVERPSVYAVDETGNHSVIGIAINALNTGMIPAYGNNGTLLVATPTLAYHATNKTYVDTLIAEAKTYADNLLGAMPVAEEGVF